MADTGKALFPLRVRFWLGLSVAMLVAVALALIAWRGPAMLLDLEALGGALWCF